MPLPNVNIKNVPMDYFLRGAEAAKPQGPQQPQAPGQQVPGLEPQQQADQAHPAGKMLGQLDVLLLKAARNGTVSVTGSKLRRTFQKLVADGAISAGSLAALEQAGNTAAKTFKALGKFSGRDLARAFDANGTFDGASTPAGKAVAAAVKAQQELADMLFTLSEGLDSLRRHDEEMRAQNPDYRGVDVKFFDSINEFRMLCDRRMTEITTLAFQMKDFALHLAANGDNADPNVAAILKATVHDLLPRQAIAMHGTADGLATVNQDIAARIRPVAEKIDAFRRDPAATITKNELRALQSDIAAMKAAIQDIRQNGVRVAGGDPMRVPEDILRGLEKEVAQAGELFKTARKEVAQTVLRNYMATALKLYTLDDNVETAARHESNRISPMLVCRNEFLVAMETLVAAALDPSKKPAELNALIQDLSRKGTRLYNAAIRAPKVAPPSLFRFNDMVSHFKGVDTMVLEISDIVCKLHEQDRFFTGREAMAVFKGEITVSSVIEARARGLMDADVDPANEPANIESDRLLGIGWGGQVFELTRKDGTVVVFKGETESSTGLRALAAGGGGNYDLEQKTVNLNFASKKAAEALGMGGMIVRYSAGVHKGAFGFFMEKAKGLTAKEFIRGRTCPDGGLSLKEIKKLPRAESRRIQAAIKRELNRLQWLDLLSGQVDRHQNNYFIHVDRETHEVTVKGIDNDAGYSQYRIGAMKFALDRGRSNVFRTLLLDTARQIDPRNAEALRNTYLHDPGITENPNGTLTIDAGRIEDKTLALAVSRTLGAQTLAIPDKIDRETYNALVALKEGPQRQAYLDSIRPRLSETSYNAAVLRLDDTIAQAERLQRENKVVETDAWSDVQETPLASGKLTTHKLNGDEKRIDGEIAIQAHDAFCPSFYARDGFEKFFR